MKTLSIVFALMLAVGGSAYAQTDTSATSAADGSYPAGTLFNGVAISSIDIGTGVLLGSDGVAEGHISIDLAGPNIPVTGPQTISVQALITGGSRPASNVATLTGTASVDMGNGTPALTGVPVVVTITTDANGKGTVGLVIGATTLPTAPITDGSLSIDDLPE
jgi:hypothetical protein